MKFCKRSILFFALKIVKYGRVQLVKNPQYIVHLFSRLLSLFPEKHCFYIILFCIIYAPAKCLGSGFSVFFMLFEYLQKQAEPQDAVRDSGGTGLMARQGNQACLLALGCTAWHNLKKKSWPSLLFPAIYFFPIDVPTSPLRTIVGFLYNIYLCNDDMSQYKSQTSLLCRQ